jgi:hypothetical protein
MPADPAAPPRLPRNLASLAPLGSGEARRALEPDVLIAAINAELAQRPECAALSISGRRWPLVEGGEQSNWSEANLALQVTGPLPPSAFATLREVIAEARRRYDVLLLEGRREAA